MSRIFPTDGVTTWRQDGLADDAVHSEPVSTSNSLITGKNTGKFTKAERWDEDLCWNSSQINAFCDVFPIQSNRELLRGNSESIFRNRECFSFCVSWNSCHKTQDRPDSVARGASR